MQFPYPYPGQVFEMFALEDSFLSFNCIEVSGTLLLFVSSILQLPPSNIWGKSSKHKLSHDLRSSFHGEITAYVFSGNICRGDICPCKICAD